MKKLTVSPSLVPRSEFRTVPLQPKTVEPYYSGKDYEAWKTAVIKRAGGRCQDPECRGSPSGRLYADHIKEVKDRPDLLLDVSNGIARCAPCHVRKTNEERQRRATR